MKTVMVVDDSRFVCEEIKHCLQGSGFEVIAYCRDAEQAMQAYNSHMPDIVLMDIILPGIDGIEATKAITTKWPAACVVMLSSLAYDDTIDRAAKAGAKNFIFKPFDNEHLLDVLEEITKPE